MSFYAEDLEEKSFMSSKMYGLGRTVMIAVKRMVGTSAFYQNTWVLLPVQVSC